MNRKRLPAQAGQGLYRYNPGALASSATTGRNTDLPKLILGRYTPSGLWSLFLMCALPLHAWTLLLAFRDIAWLTERTNSWDAIGVLCYGLLFALAESLAFFVVFVLLGLLLPRRWEPERRIALLGVYALVLALWAIVAQLFFLANMRLSGRIIEFLVASPHPLWVIYGVLLVLVLITFLVPLWAIGRPGGRLKFVGALIEKLALLGMFYLLFDVAALVIVVIRNL
jgi:hypothetical protein